VDVTGGVDTEAVALGTGPAEPTTRADEGRPLRADAAKNRERILVAAEETFAEEGVSVPVDKVAERAGVGVGTLYRHFPTKEALFEAIVFTRLQQLVEATEAFAARADAGPAFFDFIEVFAAQASAKHDLMDAMATAGIDIKTACAAELERMELGIAVLLERAKQAGAVRRDVDPSTVIGLVVGTVVAAGRRPGSNPASYRQMLDIVCDGLRPSPT